jgi:2-polyprenyl-3-methyl-5-hydroxy-6-metoxy-1,4-benzoquinol methylase
MSIKPKCPLTGSENIECVQTILVSDLAKLYWQERKIDIVSDFDTEIIELFYNEDIGFYFFWPFKSGSSDFYQQLTVSPNYEKDKNEYKFAAKYIKPLDKVLDVGCGWGWFRRYIPEAKYTGTELSQYSVNKCLENGINCKNQKIQDIAKENKKYDVAVSFQVLEHVDEPKEFFKACVDSVKSNGLVIISVPNANSYMSVMQNNYLNLPPHHVSWWSIKTFCYLASLYNLEIVDIELDKAQSMSPIFRAYFKKKMDTLLYRKYSIVRTKLYDKVLNICFSVFGKIHPKLDEKLSPNGHSLTIVMKKRR